MAIIDRLRELVEPLCHELGLEIYDLELNGGIFRVSVDKAGGVGLVDIAELTRSISRSFDVHDPISGRYTLEVSSPGLERPLRTAEHFRRAVGSRVKLKMMPSATVARRLEGVLADADDRRAVLRTAEGAELSLEYDAIEKARTVFEWGPTPRPGAAPRSKKKAAGPPAAKSAAGEPVASTRRPAPFDAGKVVHA